MAAAPRVLVESIFFAPERTANAPYVTALAHHLQEQGATVGVLSAMPHYPEWRVHQGYRSRLTLADEVDGLPVRRVRHVVPRRHGAVHRALYEASFGVRVRLSADRALRRPDVVLAVVPSLLGGLAARRTARLTGARLVVWVQDLMGPAARQSGTAGGTRVAGLVARLEEQLFTSADAVVVLNESFAAYAREHGASQVHVVPNWTHVRPPVQDRAVTRRGLDWPEEAVIALHAGNMGMKQGLENLVDMARLAEHRDCPVHVVLMGDGNQRAALVERAAGLRHLRFMPPVDEAAFPEVLAAADVLLVNERPGVKDMSQPSKLTSYCAAGRPVVAAVDEGGTTADAVRRSGAGLMVPAGRPDVLLQAVSALADDDERASRLGAVGLAHADEVLGAAGALESLTSIVLTGAQPLRQASTR